jgi:hypothetical protein
VCLECDICLCVLINITIEVQWLKTEPPHPPNKQLTQSRFLRVSAEQSKLGLSESCCVIFHIILALFHIATLQSWAIKYRQRKCFVVRTPGQFGEGRTQICQIHIHCPILRYRQVTHDRRALENTPCYASESTSGVDR